MFEHSLLSHLSYVELDMSAEVHLDQKQALGFHDRFLIFDEKGILDFHCMTLLFIIALQESCHDVAK